MSGQDFTTAIVVDQTPEQVYAAVNDVRGWWSHNIDGPTDALNGVFRFSYLQVHDSTHEVVELVPYERVVWDVLDARLTHASDEREWVGTKVVFEITEVADGTELRFTHHGLVQAFECFDACSNAWTFYINESLRDLITTGTGQPNADERRGAA